MRGPGVPGQPVAMVAGWRRLGRACGALMAGMCLTHGGAVAQEAPSRRAVELAPGVHLLPGSFERGRQPDGNSLLLSGTDGLVVVDTGRHAEHAQALLDEAGRLALPLKAVINTHWHLDHVGGNARLRREAPTLATYGSAALRDAVLNAMPASERELQAMRSDPAVDAVTRRMVDIDLGLYAERPAFLPGTVLGTAPQSLTLAGRALRVGVATGPTRGDVWVLDVASGVLAVGDFITLPVPFLDTACPADWLRSLDQLAALPFERVVPGHGPVLDRAGFQRYQQALGGLLACAAGPSTVAACAQGWIDALGPMLPALAQRSVGPMLTHYFEARLRVPPETAARHCAG